MAVAFDKLTEPSNVADYKVDTGHRKLGLGISSRSGSGK